ncbi:hypothetical protein FPV67DRAFT_1723987 [Lyophyllum atratum]|nr:hypothetical protein FPV67DRAFT_1723987 [Lyophyllum atratum]
MARHRIVPSDDEAPEEEEDMDRPPAPTPPKRQKKASEKVKHTNKENLEKAQQQLLNWQKKIARMKKADAKKASNEGSSEPENSALESEDEDEEDVAFSSSIKPLEPIIVPQPKTPTIRRINFKDRISTASKLPRRAFVNLPATSSPIGRSHPHNNVVTLDPAGSDGIADNPINDDEGGNSQTSTPSSSNKRSRSPSRATPAPPPPQAKKSKVPLREVTLRPGLNLTQAPTLADFSNPKVQALLLRAIREYEILVCTRGAFPPLSLRVQWAEACFSNAQQDAEGNDDSLGKEESSRFEFTDRMLRLIKKRGSRIRSDLLEPTRALVMSCYGFRDPVKRFDIKKNANLATSLLTGHAFHYKVPKTQTGYGGNEIIGNLIIRLWFKNKASAGIVFKRYFDPISIETLALIFTLINFCIKEWETGQHVQADFSEDDVLASHQVFHADLKEWQSLNLEVTTNKRRKLFSRACKRAGVVTEDAAQPQLTGEAKERARKELEGHTGETDSEDGDDEEDEDEE